MIRHAGFVGEPTPTMNRRNWNHRFVVGGALAPMAAGLFCFSRLKPLLQKHCSPLHTFAAEAAPTNTLQPIPHLRAGPAPTIQSAIRIIAGRARLPAYLLTSAPATNPAAERVHRLS